MVVRRAEGYVGLVEEVAHLWVGGVKGGEVGLELGLKELRPKVEEVKILGGRHGSGYRASSKHLSCP